ncbi:MAG: ATP-binding protein [Bacillota bacterium]|nr:ATP-binding protein [Bacillota bacterium]
MYPFEVAEVVLVELVANSLDAGATRICVDYDAAAKALVVADNGRGMTASQFEEYHDFAAGLKTRGTGIGFAGVGAKVSFNIANRVVTETRSSTFAGGSNWYLESSKKLLWEDWEPKCLKGCGTRVEVSFAPTSVIPFATTQDLTALLQRHYLPLMDRTFLGLYETLNVYSHDLRFVVNGEVIEAVDLVTEYGLKEVKTFYPEKAGKRVGYGLLGLTDCEYPLAPDVCGVLLCTYGKVIKGDLFNQFPGALGPCILGVVEIPGFVNFLTTAKNDFIRGRRHRELEGLYGPVRAEFKAWLAELGVQPAEPLGTDEAIKLERELKKILQDVPELSEFFGFATRGTALRPSENGSLSAVVKEGVEATFPVGEGGPGEGPGPLTEGDEPGQTLVEDAEKGTERATPISRAVRRGPRISFVEAGDRIDLAWIDGNNVVINSGHPSYRKIASDSIARRTHCLFSIGSAVQRFLGGGDGQQDVALFVDRMMAAWGSK